MVVVRFIIALLMVAIIKPVSCNQNGAAKQSGYRFKGISKEKMPSEPAGNNKQEPTCEKQHDFRIVMTSLGGKIDNRYQRDDKKRVCPVMKRRQKSSDRQDRNQNGKKKTVDCADC